MKLTKVILAGLLMLPSFFWAQETAPPENKFVPPGLAPGDQVDVHMYDFPDLGASPLHAHVSADGTVHLPYAGTIRAEGLSQDEFERAVTDSLRSRGVVKEPNVTVEVVSGVNMFVSVLGEVRTPRSISLTAPTPISLVLAQVGGVTGLASHHLTIVHHSDQAPTSVDYNPNTPGNTPTNVMILPGDIVSVSNRGVYFVAGEVNHPGVFPMGGAISVGQANATSGIGMVENITLLQALAQCGGITNVAARSKMRILRTVDGKREEILIDQVKLYKGQVADPVLHADDIIYVPSSYLRIQTNNIFSTALSSLYAATQFRSLSN